MKVIYRWYCHCCDGDFYTDWEEEPEFCPFCKETELEHKKDFEIKELKR
jgi:hypothetical protein